MKMELEEDPTVIISILAVLFDKIHNVPMNNRWGQPSRGYIASNGKEVVDFVNGSSIEWMSSSWVELLPQQEPYYQRKYLKAMKTRCKNLLKSKGSIYAIKFFIEFLIKEDETDMTIAEACETFREEQKNGPEIVFEGIEDEIPFSLLFLAPILSYVSYLDLIQIT
jgi:hypothetical protein